MIILAVVVSAMAVLFVLHEETDTSSAQVIDDGQCGPTAYYNYSTDGVLEIYGAGEMYDYGITFAPWHNYAYKITEMVIHDQITSLGECAFAGCTNAKELTIPVTVNAVSSDMMHAFAGCYYFEKISFTCGKDGYGFDYAAFNGSNNWYQNTPWYQSRACLKEIDFADGIKHIGADAFRELNLTSIVIPDSVTSLGSHCFFSCKNLTDITIPISLNSYGNDVFPAFEECMAVNKVIFTRGNGVPFDYSCIWGGKNAHLTPWNLYENITKTIVVSDDVPRLGDYMFYHCNIMDLTLPINCIDGSGSNYAFGVPYESLENVTITKGTGVGCDYEKAYADTRLPWNGTYSVKSIVVEEGVTYIGSNTFYTCCAGSLVLPNSLVGLGKQTVSYSDIKNLTLPISLNAVGLDNNESFYHAYGTEKFTFTPGSGYGYDYSAFKGYDSWYQLTPWYQCWDSVKEIVFEDGIKHIGSDAFREQYVTSLTIPNSVESLGCHTFYNCRLTELTIPITLDSICSDKYPAFEGCNGITKLRFTAGTDGVGADYDNLAPFWCYPLRHVEQIAIDSGISHIGVQTFAGYTLIGSDGEMLQPTAECLSGHIFVKTDDGTYAIDPVSGENQDASVSCSFAGYDCISAVDHDSFVKIGTIFEHDMTVGQDITAVAGLTEGRY